MVTQLEETKSKFSNSRSNSINVKTLGVEYESGKQYDIENHAVVGDGTSKFAKYATPVR